MMKSDDVSQENFLMMKSDDVSQENFNEVREKSGKLKIEEKQLPWTTVFLQTIPPY